jgi:hypothetical protein
MVPYATPAVGTMHRMTGGATPSATPGAALASPGQGAAGTNAIGAFPARVERR